MARNKSSNTASKQDKGQGRSKRDRSDENRSQSAARKSSGPSTTERLTDLVTSSGARKLLAAGLLSAAAALLYSKRDRIAGDEADEGAAAPATSLKARAAARPKPRPVKGEKLARSPEPTDAFAAGEATAEPTATARPGRGRRSQASPLAEELKTSRGRRGPAAQGSGASKRSPKKRKSGSDTGLGAEGNGEAGIFAVGTNEPAAESQAAAPANPGPAEQNAQPEKIDS